MTITTKESATGKTTGYYVNGVKVRKCEIEPLACNTDEVVYIDYHTAKQFPLIVKPSYNMKVVYTKYYGRTVMTMPAAVELGYLTGRGAHANVFYVEKLENPSAYDMEVHEKNLAYWLSRATRLSWKTQG